MTQDKVLAFCFPPGMLRDLDSHLAWWSWMMRGGADCEIIAKFADLPDQLASQEYSGWSTTAKGRLAAILVFDQFPRSIFRETPRAYAFDQLALKLVREGLENGHFGELSNPWERALFAMPLVHAEGPDLRMQAAKNLRLAKETLGMAPVHLKPAYAFCLAQSQRHKSVIDCFGRHPHRNALLGRRSTTKEQAYLSAGSFPHQQPIQAQTSAPVRRSPDR